MRIDGWPKISLILCACISSACSVQPVVTAPVACRPARVPAPLLRTHAMAQRPGDKNRDLVRLVAELATELRRCNADKAAIGRWNADVLDD